MKNKRFEEYFLQYRNLVIRIVVSKLNDYQAAQEINQQVFASLYANMDRIKPELVKAWLMRCTQNAIIDYMRQPKVKCEVPIDTSVEDTGNLLIESSMELHIKKWNDQELAGRILREVRIANESWFEILMLHCVDGLSYTEIAEKLNVPEAVLRARIRRARLFIREKFGEEYLN